MGRADVSSETTEPVAKGGEMAGISPADAFYFGLLVITGGVCGFFNTLASSGSAVSLPMLVMLGLPDAAANATNRLPVFVGSVMAMLTFWRQGEIDWPAVARLAPAAALGALAGALLAAYLPNRGIGLLITGAVLVALLLLVTKLKQALAREPDRPPRVTPLAIGLVLAASFWLGLIVVDGTAFLLIVLILVCAYSLPFANGIKVVLLGLTTGIAIIVFWGGGDIRWAEGLFLSLGSIAGGFLGARMSRQADARKWAYRLLVVAISLEVVQLAWRYGAPWRALL